MQLGEFKKSVFLKIDEYVNTEPWFTDDEDLRDKFATAFNEAVRFVFYGKSDKRVWSVFQDKSLNLFENEKECYTSCGSDIVIENEEAKAYYFEVLGKARIRVYTKENGLWSEEPRVIENPEVKEGESFFCPYRGQGDCVRIVFEGGTYYKFKNIALYGVKFSSDGNVPGYSLWAQHDIPKNMYQIMRVYRCTDSGRELCEFKVEGGKLCLPAGTEGRFEVESNFFPDMIEESTPNDTEIDVPVDCVYPVVSKCAAILTQEGSEYSEHVADAEQYMQMLDDSRSKSRVRVKRTVEF